MKEEKKIYAWLPSNCETFDDTFDSIEEAVAEAQKQWDEKYEYYEEEDENDTGIALFAVQEFNPEPYMERFGEELIEKLQEQLDNFTSGIDGDPEVCCNHIPAFNRAVKEALMPVIKDHISYYMAQVGNPLTLTYDVKTRKYTWEGKEYDVIPEAFK